MKTTAAFLAGALLYPTIGTSGCLTAVGVVVVIAGLFKGMRHVEAAERRARYYTDTLGPR